MTEILVRGRPVSIERPVVTWHESKLVFAGRPLRGMTNKIVVHWTGGEGDVQQFYRTMRGRSLSCHFYISHAGIIHQLMDAQAVGAHARGANLDSIGIEVANRGVPPSNTLHPRDLRFETIHGREVETLAFYDCQFAALIDLCAVLAEAYGLPSQVPLSALGGVEAEALPIRRVRDFRGILGHYHVTPRKIDPGVAVMQELSDLLDPKLCA